MRNQKLIMLSLIVVAMIFVSGCSVLAGLFGGPVRAELSNVKFQKSSVGTGETAVLQMTAKNTGEQTLTIIFRVTPIIQENFKDLVKVTATGQNEFILDPTEIAGVTYHITGQGVSAGTTYQFRVDLVNKDTQKVLDSATAEVEVQ